MRLPRQPDRYDRNSEQQRSNAIDQEFSDIRNTLGMITSGVGVPAFTPPGPAIYLRRDGGTNSTLYVYEGSAWAAK